MPIGRRVRGIDWPQRTTGQKHYAGDLALERMLHAAVLRSPHPHAVINRIDATAARRLPGVAAVITAADFVAGHYPHMGPAFADRDPLARDRVRFAGEGVAAVAAEPSVDLAGVLRAIKVDYRPLPGVYTVDEALGGSVAIHPRPHGTNVAAHLRRSYGSGTAGDQPELRSVTGTYSFGRQTHVCMEPSAVVARWDALAARLELWTTTQSPRFVQEEVAQVLGLRLDQVVLREVAVGGGFGARSKICDHEAIAGMLAIRSGRPVRLIYTREEEFATTKCRHDFRMTVTTRADPHGTLASQTAHFVIDNGAYNHSGPSVMQAGVGSFVSAYRCPGVDIEAVLVDTNKQPGGQFRGYGGIQAYFALESQMDLLADELGLDPIDIRIRNALRTGDVTLAGWHISSAGQVECLEVVRQRLDWEQKRALGGSGRGVGVAASLHHTGLRSYVDANRSESVVSLDTDGKVTVRFGGADPGTGLLTVLAQVASHELDVPIDDVTVLTMDTDDTPRDLGSWSSRATFMGGHAVRVGCLRLADQLREAFAAEHGVSADQVEIGDGHAGSGQIRVPLGKVVAATGQAELRVHETYEVDTELVEPVTGIASTSPSYAFAAHGVEVEVNRRTGQVTVLRVVAAQDSGTVINPVAAEGQVVGGVSMGLGAALSEQMIYEGGRLVNPSYLHYPVPRAGDMPAVDVVFVEQPDPLGPYGAKAAGEISMVPVPPAVANAVAHAVGVRITDLPITPDKVLTALRAGQPRRRYRLWRRPNRWWIELMRRLYPLGMHALLHRYGTRLAPLASAPPIEQVDTPQTVAQASRLLRQRGAALLAGGTDLMPARQQGVARPSRLVDIRLIRGFAQLRVEPDGRALWLGAGARLDDLRAFAARHGLTAIDQAIATIASSQVRAMATLGGNLCQQKRCWFFRSGFNCYKRGGATCPCYAVMGDSRYYHAVVDGHRCQAVTPSDLATVLVALDATAVITSDRRERTVPMAEFYTGPGEVALRRGELLAGVRVGLPTGWRGGFAKLRLWEGDFAVASAACQVQLAEDGTVQQARVVLGAVAPTPMRAVDTERALVGRQLSAETIATAAAAWQRHAHPLARNEWKVDAATGVLQDCLEHLAARP